MDTLFSTLTPEIHTTTNSTLGNINIAYSCPNSICENYSKPFTNNELTELLNTDGSFGCPDCNSALTPCDIVRQTIGYTDEFDLVNFDYADYK